MTSKFALAAANLTAYTMLLFFSKTLPIHSTVSACVYGLGQMKNEQKRSEIFASAQKPTSMITQMRRIGSHTVCPFCHATLFIISSATTYVACGFTGIRPLISSMRRRSRVFCLFLHPVWMTSFELIWRTMPCAINFHPLLLVSRTLLCGHCGLVCPSLTLLVWLRPPSLQLEGLFSSRTTLPCWR